ncbi:MAG: acyl-CoA dehydrogenase [Gallionellales bacterium 35-53-114]|nr:MAG: acyl-CoA dehydrogenase [Gallionellales bacterium 35-53-114]OYZ65492.1 MAG: acyl-CoA dehydrogenase [Gallionellales bacterium 24-53-125]OZB08400.1 MAG: acyl-CoA dehydrogenase [Gallionellales bacterium 39-52-133]HQS58123.1 acyl-CoA dehydrogenase [Gallionellaceae bacterium]HQS73678.1 acyl-CoA dehydrogenase [Gallionellaceae bacterium]
MTVLMVLAVITVIMLLAFFRASIWGWLLAAIVLVAGVSMLYSISGDALTATVITLGVVVLVMGVPFMRRLLISNFILKVFRKILPQVSQTEQEALDAGTVWWDGELFSGHPNWRKLLAYARPALSAEEQSFVDNETEQLCAMIDDWDVTHVRQDLPPQVWQFIKDKGFFGMIIPKEYGGLQFSALAHSAVVAKLASRSATAAVTVMVPNSLGPAELLLHYGTKEQKDKYLNRLAKGLEVPCFALTGPFAGSDAGSIPDTGVVCKGEFNGQKDVLGLRMNWEKRYITLSPVATLLGIAFKLYDPDHLLGAEEARGITLALIPTNTPGVKTGRRHFPLNSAFQNGPTSGTDVFIPLEYIIGGQERIGQGWRMLMECLAAGRSISLPASATGAAKLSARTSGAYGRVRKQFKMPVGKFEGVEEALARIGGNVYMMEATRVLTASAVDMGEKPSVISAIAKYHCTERSRSVINDAMDLHGGKGICMGPDNYLARAYQQIPIGITVEGANILTRSLIIFGQGAVRAHPYVLREIKAAHNPDKKQALLDFDAALWGHVSFSMSNAVRALVFGLTGGRGVDAPTEAPTRRYYQQLTRYSSGFAFAADVAMLVLGGSLKRREKISARLGDVLSQMYLCSATLKRFEDDGRPEADLPLLHWSMQDALFRIQEAFDGVLQNFPNRLAAWLLRRLIFPLGKGAMPPSDALGHQVATMLMQPGSARDRLTVGMHIPRDEKDAVGALEAALLSTLKCEPVQASLAKARKEGKLTSRDELEQIAEAGKLGLINSEQVQLLQRDYALRRKIIMVDDFDPAQLPAG